MCSPSSMEMFLTLQTLQAFPLSLCLDYNLQLEQKKHKEFIFKGLNCKVKIKGAIMSHRLLLHHSGPVFGPFL